MEATAEAPEMGYRGHKGYDSFTLPELNCSKFLCVLSNWEYMLKMWKSGVSAGIFRTPKFTPPEMQINWLANWIMKANLLLISAVNSLHVSKMQQIQTKQMLEH